MEQMANHDDLEKLKEALAKGEIQCLTTSELLIRCKRIDQELYSAEIISRLQEINLSTREHAELERIIEFLISESELISYRDRTVIHDKLYRLIPMLPEDSATQVTKSLFKHPRKTKRDLGYKLLKIVGFDKDLAQEFITRYQETGDQEYLKMVARSTGVIPKLDYIYLLQSLTEQYWRMRIIEGLLRAKNYSDIGLAHKYPFEFTYAVGRLRHDDSLSILSELLMENCDDLDFLSMYAWTAGKLKARKELGKVRKLVEKLCVPK